MKNDLSNKLNECIDLFLIHFDSKRKADALKLKKHFLEDNSFFTNYILEYIYDFKSQIHSNNNFIFNSLSESLLSDIEINFYPHLILSILRQIQFIKINDDYTTSYTVTNNIDLIGTNPINYKDLLENFQCSLSSSSKYEITEVKKIINKINNKITKFEYPFQTIIDIENDFLFKHKSYYFSEINSKYIFFERILRFDNIIKIFNILKLDNRIYKFINKKINIDQILIDIKNINFNIELGVKELKILPLYINILILFMNDIYSIIPNNNDNISFSLFLFLKLIQNIIIIIISKENINISPLSHLHHLLIECEIYNFIFIKDTLSQTDYTMYFIFLLRFEQYIYNRFVPSEVRCKYYYDLYQNKVMTKSVDINIIKDLLVIASNKLQDNPNLTHVELLKLINKENHFDDVKWRKTGSESMKAILADFIRYLNSQDLKLGRVFGDYNDSNKKKNDEIYPIITSTIKNS